MSPALSWGHYEAGFILAFNLGKTSSQGSWGLLLVFLNILWGFDVILSSEIKGSLIEDTFDFLWDMFFIVDTLSHQ